MPYLIPAERDQVPVVERWLNVRRDLRAACKRVDIAPVSANDLRRTYSSWMKQSGEDSALVARLLGHSSTRMVDLVYGHLSDENFIRAAAKLPCVEAPPPGSTSVAERGLPARTERPLIGCRTKCNGRALPPVD